ncbi:MAG: hypothetical protein ACQUHE_11035 [Bacteroidia bacterium]
MASQSYDAGADPEISTSKFEFDSSGDYPNAQVYSESSQKLKQYRQQHFLRERFGFLSPVSPSSFFLSQQTDNHGQGQGQDKSASASASAYSSQISQVQTQIHTSSSALSCSCLHISQEQQSPGTGQNFNTDKKKRGRLALIVVYP